MPKVSKHPRFRVHVKRGKAGQVWTSYWYDMRGTGEPDVALGNDREAALKQWDELHNLKPRIAGTIEEAFTAWEKDVLPVYASAETRKGYTRDLKRIRPIFGPATWEGITLKDLKGYLKRRSAKTRANRELALFSLIWNWARGVYTELHWPAAGLQRSRWKNKEKAREIDVTDAMFSAVYAEADQVLRDVMDLATATGMRLTDCRTVLLPAGDSLRLKASKTGKATDFDLSLSLVLPELIARRRAAKVTHLMLISSPTGRPVSARMLRERWDEARAKAVARAAADGDDELADAIRGLWLRDMRKRAAQILTSDEEAADLLQHGDVRTTRRHYRTNVKTLRPAR